MAHVLKRIKLPCGIPAQVEVWQLGIDLQLPIKDRDLALLSDAERLTPCVIMGMRIAYALLQRAAR